MQMFETFSTNWISALCQISRRLSTSLACCPLMLTRGIALFDTTTDVLITCRITDGSADLSFPSFSAPACNTFQFNYPINKWKQKTEKLKLNGVIFLFSSVFNDTDKWKSECRDSDRKQIREEEGLCDHADLCAPIEIFLSPLWWICIQAQKEEEEEV